MRRSFLSLLLMAIVAASGFGLLWVLVGLGTSSAEAEATLTRLSKRGESLTYYVQYGAALDGGPANPVFPVLTIHSKPGVGFRIELLMPLLTDEDVTEPDDLLKSGDIFIWDLRPPGKITSCRTTRESCRSADIWESVAVLFFATLFRFDQPVYEQPHRVTRVGDISATGETAQCFEIAQRLGNANEQATAESSGFVPGGDLPKTFCYAPDGLPLGGLISDPPDSSWLIAMKVRRDVDSALFTEPFQFVPSMWDDFPPFAEPPQ